MQKYKTILLYQLYIQSSNILGMGSMRLAATRPDSRVFPIGILFMTLWEARPEKCKKRGQLCTGKSSKIIWRFPAIKVPTNHQFIDGIFHYINHPFRGTSMTMEPPLSPLLSSKTWNSNWSGETSTRHGIWLTKMVLKAAKMSVYWCLLVKCFLYDCFNDLDPNVHWLNPQFSFVESPILIRWIPNSHWLNHWIPFLAAFSYVPHSLSGPSVEASKSTPRKAPRWKSLVLPCGDWFLGRIPLV